MPVRDFVEIKTSHFSTGLYSANFNIDVEKLKPAKKYNKLHCKNERKIIEYEEVCLNCIDTTMKDILFLITVKNSIRYYAGSAKEKFWNFFLY